MGRRGGNLSKAAFDGGKARYPSARSVSNRPIPFSCTTALAKESIDEISLFDLCLRCRPGMISIVVARSRSAKMSQAWTPVYGHPRLLCADRRSNTVG